MIKERIVKVEQTKKVGKEAILEQPKFLELFDSLPQTLRENRELEYQDFIIRKIFLNSYIDISEGTGIKNKIYKFGLKKPFEGFLKNEIILTGRGGGI